MNSTPNGRGTARRWFPLSATAACLTLAFTQVQAANCAPDASVASTCSFLQINNPDQTITIEPTGRVDTPFTLSVWFKPTATGITFVNNGTITSRDESLFNQGAITSFVNNGVIESGIHFYNQATIGTLTNLGSITGYYRSIYSTATITTLNNRQGGASPLHLSDSLLPTNYNIIIDSPTVYGKLSAPRSEGVMNFGIYGTSVVAPGTYEDVLSEVDASQLGTTTGTFAGLAWSLRFDGTSYDLVFAPPGPSPQATMSSLRAAAQGLRGAFGIQTAYLNPGLSYDCALFDSRGLCVAASGRDTAVQGSDAGATSGVLTLAYRLHPNLRVGGYLEQTLGTRSDPSVSMHRGNPDLGLFAVWNQNSDGAGLQVRLAHRQGRKDVDLTRPTVAGSEPGSGTADLITRGTQLTLSHAMQLNDTWRLSPYAGVRATRIERGAYDERASASVTTPLSYGALKERATVLLLGSQVSARLAPRFTLTGFAGIDHDLSRKTTDFSATGLTALQPFQFADNPKRSRPVASLGAIYDVDKTRQVSVQWVYRKEPFATAATRSLLATYSAGF
jgi:hypothetical protein